MGAAKAGTADGSKRLGLGQEAICSQPERQGRAGKARGGGGGLLVSGEGVGRGRWEGPFEAI